MGIYCALLCECSLIAWCVGNIVVCIFEAVSSLYAAPSKEIHHVVTTTHGIGCAIGVLCAGHKTDTTTIEHSTFARDDVHHGGECHVTI